MIEETVYTALSGVAYTSPMLTNQEIEEDTYITYFRVSTQDSCFSNKESVFFQADLYSNDDYKLMRQKATQVKTALRNINAVILNDGDLYEDDTRRHRVSFDFRLQEA